MHADERAIRTDLAAAYRAVAVVMLVALEAAAQFGPTLDAKREREKAMAAALPAGTRVEILDQGILTVPKGMVFIPRENTMSILASTGQGPTPETVGMLTPTAPDGKWRAVLQFFRGGYVAIAPGTRWDPERELARMRASEARENPGKLRQAGFSTHAQAWLEPPQVDAVSASYLYGLMWVERSASGDRLQLTLAGCKFGRQGHLQVRFQDDDPATATERKGLAREVLAAFEFRPGRRHADATHDDPKADDVLGLHNPLARRC